MTAGNVLDELSVDERRWLPPVSRRSAITVGVLVVLFLGPWSGYGRLFRVMFVGYANGVVSLFNIGGDVGPRFSVPEPAKPPYPEPSEWTVSLSTTSLDTRILGYTPLAIFLALTLASAVSLRRKLIILGGGLALLLARLAVAIALPVARSLGGLRSGSPLDLAAELVWWVLITTPAMSYVTPLLIWWVGLAVTARAAASGAGARVNLRAAPGR